MGTPVNYAAQIAAATLDIFETMIPMEVTSGEPMVGEKIEISAYLTSMLGLSGDFAGMLNIHCPSDIACLITGAMLGMEVDEVDEDVKDALGEVANMVAGGLKISLADSQIDVELAIPSVIAGKSYTITAPEGTQKVVVPFETPSGPFWVELKFRRTS